jgi:hypothetical protein
MSASDKLHPNQFTHRIKPAPLWGPSPEYDPNFNPRDIAAMKKWSKENTEYSKSYDEKVAKNTGKGKKA